MPDSPDSRDAKHPVHDFDSPWKEAIEQDFQGFLALAAPKIHDAIDWSVKVRFRSTELQKLRVEDLSPRQQVDLLVEVTLTRGGRAQILCHVEVQAQNQKRFAERMFRYHIRIHERFGLPVFSLAFLIDPDPSFRPTTYSNRVLGTGCEFRFLAVKLLDFRGLEAELQASENPFAFVILAQLKVLDTGLDRDRLHWKVDLIRRLLKKRFSRQRIRTLLRLIDWIMLLPPGLGHDFESVLGRLQEEHKVAFISTFERMARKQGLREGIERGMERGIERGIERGATEARREALLAFLEARFGTLPEALVRTVREDLKPEELEPRIRKAAVIESLAEF